MKTKQNAISKTEVFTITKAEKVILQHILSPLELFAWDNEYKAFTYHLNGIPISVSAKDSMQLIATSKAKMNTFLALIFKTYSNLKVSKTAKRFLESDISEHQLPNYLLKQIHHQYQCQTPYDVLQLGKQQLKATKGIGKTGIKSLETLFEKHKCQHLFESAFHSIAPMIQTKS